MSTGRGDRRVARMTPADEPAYGRFVEAHPHAMLYHSLPYVKLIAELTGSEQETLLSFDPAGELNGVLPALSKVGPHGRVINSLPYYGSNGGALAADAPSAADLVRAYNRLAVADDVAAATLVGNPLTPPDSAGGIAHTLTDYRIGQFTDIAHAGHHAEALMQSYHHKTRNMVRKAQKSGLRVSVDDGMIEFLRDVHHENMSAIGGRAKSACFFDLLPRYFRAGRDYKIWVAHDHSGPVAALLLFYFRGTVEYYMPVIREASRDKQPLSLIICDAMADASRHGFTLWNWGGTWATQDGLYMFKARWGTRDVNYTYFVQVNNEALYSATRESLLTHYPDFFVIPFQLLKTAS